MLISTEHEISTAQINLNVEKYQYFLLSDVVLILHINVKMSTFVGILTFMSKINFMVSWVKLKKFYDLEGQVIFHLLCIYFRFIWLYCDRQSNSPRICFLNWLSLFWETTTVLLLMCLTDKVILLGSAFLIDFHYFERQQRCCCWCAWQTK